MSDDIVKRLREHVEHRGGASFSNGAWGMMLEAADEIDKLRAALKPFADKEHAYDGWADTARNAVWLNISDLRAAKAALGE